MLLGLVLISIPVLIVASPDHNNQPFEPAMVVLTPTDSFFLERQHLALVEDSERDRPFEALLETAQWQPVVHNPIPFGHQKSAYIVRIDITNTSNQDGYWIVGTDLCIADFMDIYQQGESGLQKVTEYRLYSRFAERDIDFRNITGQIEIKAHSSTTVYIHYASVVTSSFIFPRIHAMKNFEKKIQTDYFILALFFGAMLCLIMVNLFQYFALKNVSCLLFCFQAFFYAIFTSQITGFNYQHLWPEQPEFNNFAYIFFGTGILISASIFAKTFLNTKVLLPKVNTLFNGIIASAIALLILHPFIFPGTAALIGWVLYVAIIVTGILAGFTVYRMGNLSAGLYSLGCVFHIGLNASALSSIANLFGIYIHIDQSFLMTDDWNKISILIEGLTFTLALSRQINELKIENDKAKDELLINIQNRLYDAELLSLSEQEKNAAFEQIQNNAVRIASATHDLLQPISSIKIAMDRLDENESNKAVLEHIRNSLDFLADMTISITGDSRDEFEQNSSAIPLNDILLGCQNHYSHKAAEKSLTLTVKETDLNILKAHKIYLTRILDNLINNAILYTSKGSISIYVRSDTDRAFITIEDTGPGFTNNAIEDLSRPFIRGDNPEKFGFGLGLSIVRYLCHESNYSLNIDSTPGKGSKITVGVPVAK